MRYTAVLTGSHHEPEIPGTCQKAQDPSERASCSRRCRCRHQHWTADRG
jgi:hypothetical protein